MKKQYFIFLAIAGMSAVMNVKAQNTPIDDFLKKYPSREGVTVVSMSQQMLQSIFAPPDHSNSGEQSASTSTSTSTSVGVVVSGFGLMPQKMNVPEAYSSVTISKKDIPENLFADFKKTLLSSKYEQFMEMNKENNSILGYYLKKVNDKTNEIVVLRFQKDQFSAIYIKGDIDVNYVNHHLSMIKSALNRLGADHLTDKLLPYQQFAFTMPSFDDLKMKLPKIQEFNFKINTDSLFNNMGERLKIKMNTDSLFNMDERFKIRMEKSMEKMKDLFQTEDFQRKIQESAENLQKQLEEH